MLFLIMLAITLGHFLKKSKHKYLQEAGLTTLLGMVAGIVLKQTHEEFLSKKISGHFNNLFMILLLPPIIFEGGYNMQKRPFFKNIGSVLAYSFLGTFVAILISSSLFYAASNGTPDSWWPAFTLKESFAFGSLISATDPVSVLAIFKEMDADVNLYSIVFGESIFNDAIGIVMYETVRDLGTDKDATVAEELFGAVGQFTLIFVGSLAIGMVSALLVAFILKRAALGVLTDFAADGADPNASNASQPQRGAEDSRNGAGGGAAEQAEAGASPARPAAARAMTLRQRNYVEQQDINQEVSLMLMSPWVTYLVTDGLGLSGIVAILTNGIFLNMYAIPNISRGSRKVLKMSYETIAYSAETLVFIFLGIGVFAFEHPTKTVGAGAIILTILILNFARFCNIGVVTALVNRARSSTKINKKQQFVMWIAGLRGAMAYALAIESIFDFGEAGRAMLYLTVIYGLITILIVGSILHPVLIKCEVTRGAQPEPPSSLQAEPQPKDSSENVRCCKRLKTVLYNFNHVYFAPLFIKVDEKPRASYAARDPSPGRPSDVDEQAVNLSDLKAADDIDWRNDEAYRGKKEARGSEVAHDPEDKKGAVSAEINRQETDSDL